MATVAAEMNITRISLYLSVTSIVLSSLLGILGDNLPLHTLNRCVWISSKIANDHTSMIDNRVIEAKIN